MPITKELKNIRKFESVGFSHEQAETLTDVIENAIFYGQQSLKDFINDKFEEFRAEVETVLVQAKCMPYPLTKHIKPHKD